MGEEVIPAEIAVILLFLFILYQSVMGFLRRNETQDEFAKVWEKVRTLDTDVDDIDKRVEKLEP